MNKIYSLLSGLFLLTLTTFAQTGGTYTAIHGGSWHAAAGHPDSSIWQGAEPPMSCANCVINLNFTGGGMVFLNAHVVLSANSKLNIGDGTTANAVSLSIGNSGATDSSHANSITMINDNTGTVINATAGSSLVVTPNVGNAGDFDGVFTAYTTAGTPVTESFFKSVGYAPDGIVNNTVVNGQPPTYNELLGQTMNSTGTLPILLSQFSATLNEGGVDVDWTTALEINSDHFVIERSSNAGAGWDAIGTVSAHGNSVEILHYAFTDSKPLQGTAEYRLEMVDKDGKYAYSDVKSIRTGMVTAVSVYPNPARDFVNVTLGSASGFTLIRLYNQGGQLLQEKSLNNPGETVVPLAVSGYPEGSYVVVVTGADGSRQANKVVVTK